MSRIDSANFPNRSTEERFVCLRCFSDEDLNAQIRANGTRGRCSYCMRRTRHTVPLTEIAEFIEQRIRAFYGTAVDQLPYDSREGGYQGVHWDTRELLFEEIGLAIEAVDHDSLMHDLLAEIEDEVWSEYDWTSLALDDSLVQSWKDFRRITMGQRRFFFHAIGGSDSLSHPDDRSAGEFLAEVAARISSLQLLRTIDAGHSLFRVREQTAPPFELSAANLGPPPGRVCLQSNRMNPPGIPMFYGAEDERTAIAEARATQPVVGRFETIIPLTIVDLANLPRIPGFFSKASRDRRQGLSFFHRLSRAMAAPVDRTDRVNVDYIPTQIVTEFLRDHSFHGHQLHGIRYISAVADGAANVVLFTEPENVIDLADEPSEDAWLMLSEASEFDGA